MVNEYDDKQVSTQSESQIESGHSGSRLGIGNRTCHDSDAACRGTNL
jgi:hypothetical protein